MKPTNKEQTNRSIEINFISSFLDVVGDHDEAGKKTGQRHLSVILLLLFNLISYLPFQSPFPPHLLKTEARRSEEGDKYYGFV